MATVWFADNERALATAFGSLSMPLGCIMGMVIGPFYVSDDDITNGMGRDHIKTYMLDSAIICTLMSVWTVMFYREKPMHYPSKAATQSDKEEFDFKKDLKLLFANKNYIFMIISQNLLYGVYTCLGAIINNLVVPFGYTSSNSSLFGVVFIFFGLVGSFKASSYLDRT